MPKLEDRKMCCHPACLRCKHMMVFDGYDHEFDHWQESYWCGLGLTEDEMDYVMDEADEKGYNLDEAHFGDDQYSDQFLELMQMKPGEQDVYESPRFVNSTDCCNFYEKDC